MCTLLDDGEKYDREKEVEGAAARLELNEITRRKKRGRKITAKDSLSNPMRSWHSCAR